MWDNRSLAGDLAFWSQPPQPMRLRDVHAAVSSRKRLPAATWSSIWYLLSAFAVISYTKIGVVGFAAVGSFIGAIYR